MGAGTIIYKPHCKECGALINNEVTYRKFKMIFANKYLCNYGYIDIEPYRCEICGAVFETIEVPMPKESKPAEVLSYAESEGE